MSRVIVAIAAVTAAACKQEHAAARPSSMADLIAPADRARIPDAAPADPRVVAAATRFDDAVRAAQARSEPAAMRAELRVRLGAPSLELDGWIEWAIAPGDIEDECDTVWLERADSHEVEHHRYTSADADADVDACRALAGGDARPRIIDSLAYAHGSFDSPAAARAWLRRNLGAPSRELYPGDDHKSVWAQVVGGSCFTIQVDDARFDHAIAGQSYRDFEPEYVDCERWSEGRGG